MSMGYMNIVLYLHILHITQSPTHLPTPHSHTPPHTIRGLQGEVCIILLKLLLLAATQRCSGVNAVLICYDILSLTLPLLIVEALEGPSGKNEG